MECELCEKEIEVTKQYKDHQELCRIPFGTPTFLERHLATGNLCLSCYETGIKKQDCVRCHKPLLWHTFSDQNTQDVATMRRIYARRDAKGQCKNLYESAFGNQVLCKGCMDKKNREMQPRFVSKDIPDFSDTNQAREHDLKLPRVGA